MTSFIDGVGIQFLRLISSSCYLLCTAPHGKMQLINVPLGVKSEGGKPVRLRCVRRGDCYMCFRSEPDTSKLVDNSMAVFVAPWTPCELLAGQ